MRIEVFFMIYLVLITIVLFLEIYLLANDNYKYIRNSLKHLSRLFERNNKIDSVELVARELKRLYIQYTREYGRFSKFYPNIIVWLDAIIFRIDTYNKMPQILLDSEQQIKEAREILEAETPFYQCNEYQQEILRDISQLENSDNKIIVKNILDRAGAEFLRQNTDNERNRILNIISVVIGLEVCLVLFNYQNERGNYI